MSKFKVGDRVVLVDSTDNPSVLKNGLKGIVLDQKDIPFVQFDVDKNDELNDACGLGEDGKCFAVCEYEIKLISDDYIQSNRYKLHQAIKKTGFQSERLSLASGYAKTYFTGFTAESRFNSRGDITEERLNALLVTLAFSERELLGLGAKTVDGFDLSKDIAKTATELNNNVFDTNKHIHNENMSYYNDRIRNDSEKLSTFSKVGIFVLSVLLILLFVYNGFLK